MLEFAESITHSYQGNTLVQGGSLVINGTLGDSGAGKLAGNVVVGSGATLAGTGTIILDGGEGKTVTVNQGGTLRGGSAADPTGPLMVSGPTSIIGAATGAGTLAVDLNGTGTSGATVSRLVVPGGSTLNFQTTGVGTGPVAIQLLNDGSLTPGNPYSFTIANGDVNVFLLNGIPVSSYTHNADFTLRSANFSFSEVTLTVDGSNNLVLGFTPVPVPEPATVMGIAAAALGLGGLVRRLRRGKAQEVAAAVPGAAV